jgi:hypothetical protein
MGHY